MFKPLPMQRVSLQVLREDALHAAMVLASRGVFNPEAVDVADDRLQEFPAERYREVYTSARTRLNKIRRGLRCPPDKRVDTAEVVELATLERVDTRVGELWRRFSALAEEQRALEDRRKSLHQLRDSLETFADLDVDLGLFHRPKRFLSLRVGTMPRSGLQRLEGAVSLAGHILRPFRILGDTAYVVVAGPSEAGEDVSALLRTADFRPVKIPPEFSDHPDKIKRRLTDEAAELDGRLAQKEAEISALGVEHWEELATTCRTLTLAAPYAALAGRLRGQGGLAVVEGWMPRDEVEGLSKALLAGLGRPFVMNTRDPLPEERGQVPSVLRHSRLLRPFVALVKNYGVPRYGEIDPTILFTITFIAMFGMMFGDIGHGAVIVAGGLLAYRRFPAVVPFVVAAGLSSVTFGFVYGSLFGYEHLIHPLWMSPLSDPLLMLELALYWGIGFILLMNLLTIRNLLDEGHYQEALLDTKGVAGTVLYLGGIYAGFRWVGEGIFGIGELAAIFLPLSVILVYKWREYDSPLGERILVVFVEGFESITNYLANTLSFLRVAAFSLNHVALAIAVFTLADTMGTAGHWITVVLGNVFIIVVEGAIVTIQCLRLEYYEGFSRFFRGDGREFRPLKFEAPEA